MVLIELFHKGVRTAYRTLGARRVEHVAEGATVRGFLFESPREPTIVFLHGLGDASTTWFRLVRALQRHARVVALDLPPFGISELDAGFHLSPRDQAALVAPVVEEHATGPVTLVGQSMGGWVAQWLLHDQPDLVDRSVLISPGGARLSGTWRTIDLLTPHTPEDTRRYIDALWFEPPPGHELMIRPLLERLHEPAVRGFLSRIDEQDILTEDQLASIGTPTRILWGSHDRLLDPRTPAFLAQHWGGPVTRSYLARSGHMPHQERPRATVRSILDALALDER